MQKGASLYVPMLCIAYIARRSGGHSPGKLHALRLNLRVIF